MSRNSQGWTKPKSGTQNSMQISSMGGRDARAGATICSLQMHSSRKPEQKQSSWDSNQAL